MAKEINRLKALTVSKATKPGKYCDGLNLYLVVSPAGAKSWIFRYRRQGRLRDMGLGPTHTVSLAQARALSLEYRRLRLEGLDPLEIRRAKRAPAPKGITFKQCAEACVASHEAGWWGTKNASQWASSLSAHVLPIFGDLPVREITVDHVMKALVPIWEKKPTTADRVRQRIEATIDWAIARNYRSGPNPARWRGHLEQLLPKKSAVRPVVHHPALPHQEIASFVAMLRERRAISARALEFLILTAGRTNEVIGARWEEFDLAARIWTVPAVRMKGRKGHRREHRVPLSNEAISIITAMREIAQHSFVFFGQKSGRSIQSTTMRTLLRDLGRDDLTIHGFRAAFRNWAADTGFPRELGKAALAHVLSPTEGAYERTTLVDRRRPLMDAWAAYATKNLKG
jgi:integrase